MHNKRIFLNEKNLSYLRFDIGKLYYNARVLLLISIRHVIKCTLSWPFRLNVPARVTGLHLQTYVTPFSKYLNCIIAVSPPEIWLLKSQYLTITFLYAAIRLVVSGNCFYFVRPKRPSVDRSEFRQINYSPLKIGGLWLSGPGEILCAFSLLPS